MNEDRQGTVVTFYSYKGGTGRTMALANLAWLLAANGKRVLVADWDLESPGLHRFFKPFLDTEMVDRSTGVIDMIRRYESATSQPGERPANWHEMYAQVRRYAFSLSWEHFPDGGCVDFLPAGRQSEAYAPMLADMNWDDLYASRGGGQFFAALRQNMKATYDYTLIDSRTGHSDVGAICTVELPDVLVCCFTLSEQGIDGAARTAERISRRYADRAIRILPVAMRVDPAEKERAEAGRFMAMRRFERLPLGMSDAERDTYWNAVEVPYLAYYAYEELLATFGDRPGQANSLLASYERLAGYVTNGAVRRLPVLDEGLRQRALNSFIRHVSTAEVEVTLRYAPESQVWAEWITEVLMAAGVRVNDPHLGVVAASSRGGGRQVTIVSQYNAKHEATVYPRDSYGANVPLVVYVDDVDRLPQIPPDASVSLVGQAADVAIGRLLRMVRRMPGEPIRAEELNLRYPGEEPRIFNVPARNARFTGREPDLRDLRANLRASGSAVVLSGAMPVALQGMGGIGKTQLATEYAHRFKNAYDLIWWVSSDPVTFVDTSLAELGVQLELGPAEAKIPDLARASVAALTAGRPHRRWLLIFDNAEDMARVGSFLPQGSGHLMITSRNTQWGERARSMHVEVFQRAESVAHLRGRVPTIRAEDAVRVAELLGDLPIAVAAAGAWLSETGTDVGEYLNHIERHGPAELRDETNQSIERTWDLSLRRLQERSPAAYRLLQLCSVMAPDVALEMVYGDEFANLLEPLDPMVSERVYRGSLVQQINRLALVKLDVGGGRIHVHRLLQHVVRNRMSADELSAARHEVHLVLAASRPRHDVDDPRSWPRFRMLWPHLEISQAAECPEESVRQLMIERVRYLWQGADTDEALRVGQRVARIWAARLADTRSGPDQRALHRQLLHLRFNVANAVREMAEFEQARAMDEEVLHQQTELLGPKHPHTLMTASGLAADLRALGRYAEARKQDASTYAAWSDGFGEDYPRTLLALNNLATTLRLAGDFRGARERDQLAYERRRIVLGDLHPHTLSSGASLARDLREAGEYQASLALLELIVRQYREVLGPSALRTLGATANMAVSLRIVGDPERAAELLDRTYEQLLETVGARHPETVACRLSRAVSLLAVGQVAVAGTELAQVAEIYRAGLGDHHPHTMVCLTDQAAVARAQGDLYQAQRYADRAASGFLNALGESHPYTLAAQSNKAILLAECDQARQAEPLIADVYRRHLLVFGPDHPDSVRCAANQAMIKAAVAGGQAPSDELADELARALRNAQHSAVVALRLGRYLHRTLDPHPY